MHDLYTKTYAKLTLKVLEDCVKDLSSWSAYNQDLGNEEIDSIKVAIESLQEKIDYKDDDMGEDNYYER